MSSPGPSAADFDELDVQVSALYNDPEFTPEGAQKGRWKGFWTAASGLIAIWFALTTMVALVSKSFTAPVYVGIFFAAAAGSLTYLSQKRLRGQAKAVSVILTALVFVVSITVVVALAAQR